MTDIATLTSLSDTLLNAFFEAGLGVRSDSNGVESDVADRFQTVFVDGHLHPVGTAKMGADSDETVVVDPDLRFRGVNGLRIADASVMPQIIRGHTVAPSAFIGHRAAELIATTAE